MQSFAETLSVATRATLLIGLAVATLVLAALHEKLFKPVKELGGGRIIALELARTPNRARSVLGSWSIPGTKAARRAIYVDFAFLVAYATFFALACGSLAGVIGERTWQWMATAVSWAGAGALAAGVLDALENLFMLRTIDAYLNNSGIAALDTRGAWFAASLKFLLLLLVVVALLGGLWVLAAGAA